MERLARSAPDRTILAELQAALAERTPVVLATVTDSDHSVPRRPGSKMLVYPDAQISGTIGGGELEARVIAESLTALTTGHPCKVSYELIDTERGDPGVCGGVVELYLEPHVPALQLLVLGAGETASLTAELAAWVGYDAAVVPLADLSEHDLDAYTTVVMTEETQSAPDAVPAELLWEPTDLGIGASTPHEQALAIVAALIARHRSPAGRGPTPISGDSHGT